MRAGALDRRITIEHETESVDAYGTVTRIWSPIATGVAAELVQQSLAEQPTSYGEQTTGDLVFRLRWRLVEMHDRVLFDGTTYDIIEARPIGRRVGLELKVRAAR